MGRREQTGAWSPRTYDPLARQLVETFVEYADRLRPALGSSRRITAKQARVDPSVGVVRSDVAGMSVDLAALGDLGAQSSQHTVRMTRGARSVGSRRIDYPKVGFCATNCSPRSASATNISINAQVLISRRASTCARSRGR